MGLAVVALGGEESGNSLSTSFSIFIAGVIEGWVLRKYGDGFRLFGPERLGFNAGKITGIIDQINDFISDKNYIAIREQVVYRPSTSTFFMNNNSQNITK